LAGGYMKKRTFLFCRKPDISILQKTGHFYFAENRTFLFCIDTIGFYCLNPACFIL